MTGLSFRTFFHQLQSDLKEAEEKDKQLTFEKKSLEKGEIYW